MRIIVFVSALFLFCFSSCFVIRNGNISSGPLLNTKDKYVDIARGKAVTYTVFNIGGYYRDALAGEAKLDMYKNRPLKSGEYYSNFIIGNNTKIWLGGIVVVNKIVVSADVLSQNDSVKMNLHPTSDNVVIGTNMSQRYFKLDADTFKVGDIVYSNVGDIEADYYKMEIMSIADLRVNLRFVDGSNDNKLVKYNKAEFFSINKSNNGYKVGEKVMLISAFDKTKTTDAQILGVNSKKILVSTAFGMYSVLPERLKR